MKDKIKYTKIKYTMGIDVGVGSLGIAIISNDKIVDGVSLIYPTAKTKADRRIFRGQRTQIQRKSTRLERLRKNLSELLSVDKDIDRTDLRSCKKEKNSVVRLRSKGTTELLPNTELFKVLMHLARNRGLRLSIGKSDADKKESKGLKSVVNNFCKDIGKNEDGKPLKYLTVGVKCADLEAQGKTFKMRRSIDGELEIFYSRSKVEEELSELLKIQQDFGNSVLTDEIIAELKDSKNKVIGIFWEQEVDKAKIEASIGNCCYNIHPLRINEYTTHNKQSEKNTKHKIEYEKRLAISNPIFQEKRLLEQLNNIRVRQNGKLRDDDDALKLGALTLVERKSLFDYTKNRKETSAEQIKKKIKLSIPDYVISLESSYSRKKKAKASSLDDRVIKGNSFLIAIKNTLLEKLWGDITEEKQNKCLEHWNADDLERSKFFFSSLFADNNISCTDEELEKVCDITLENGYSSAGITATKWLIKELKKDVITLDEAEMKLGLTHRKSATGEKPFDTLPYYGVVLETYCIGGTYNPTDTLEKRYGWIQNSVVSSSLNKLRKSINAFIKKHGKPESINVEMSRHMAKSEEERYEIQRQIIANQKENDKLDKTITGYGLKPSRKLRRALKLYDWQKTICPYTGQHMVVGDIFHGKAVLDHILPRSITSDDSLSNLVLCKKEANDLKGDNSPYAAFAGGYKSSDGEYILYEEILQRIAGYPYCKRKRFDSDAMDRFKEEDGFLKRYETDTSYLSKVAKEYLGCISSKPIRVLTGGITQELRHNWGVNNILNSDNGDTDKKNRDDNRHHLLDAIVIACAERAQIQALHKYNKNKEWKKKEPSPEPWEGFRNDVKDFLSDPSLVMHEKMINNKQGELHRQTTYRLVADIYSVGKSGKNKGIRKYDKSVVRVKSSLLELFNMTGLTKNMSEDDVMDKIAEKILSTKNEKNIKKRLDVNKIDDIEIPKDLNEPDGKKKYILNELEVLNSLISMREAIVENYKNTNKKQETENIPTLGNPEKTKVEDRTPKERLKDAIELYIKDTGRKKYIVYRSITKLEIRNKRIEEDYKRNSLMRPSRISQTSGNSHMDIFKHSNDELDWQCIARIDANKKPRWCEDYPDAKLIMSIKKNDEFTLFDTKTEKDIVVKLTKISEGNISFYPVEVANMSDDLMKKRISIQSIGSLKTSKLQKIRRDYSGEIV